MSEVPTITLKLVTYIQVYVFRPDLSKLQSHTGFQEEDLKHALEASWGLIVPLLHSIGQECHKATSDLRNGGTVSNFWWEERQGHNSKSMDSRRIERLWPFFNPPQYVLRDCNCSHSFHRQSMLTSISEPLKSLAVTSSGWKSRILSSTSGL